MDHPTASPLDQFTAWYREADAADEPQLDAISLATASRDGKPSVRIVLFKGLSDGGFAFYTNYESRKARELMENPQAAIAFFWPTLERQVRIEGRVEKVSREESERYFATRPRGSQIGAWASRQSQVISSRDFLEAKVAELEKRYQGAEVPCPEHWGGFRLVPETIEFWQGKANRLHDRHVFRRRGEDWKIERLSP